MFRSHCYIDVIVVKWIIVNPTTNCELESWFRSGFPTIIADFFRICSLWPRDALENNTPSISVSPREMALIGTRQRQKKRKKAFRKRRMVLDTCNLRKQIWLFNYRYDAPMRELLLLLGMFNEEVVPLHSTWKTRYRLCSHWSQQEK